MNDNVALSDAVLTAVGQSEAVDPAALRQRLFDSIDPDALDRLFRGTRGHVTFEYQDYRVTVDSDGDVTLEPLAE